MGSAVKVFSLIFSFQTLAFCFALSANELDTTIVSENIKKIYSAEFSPELMNQRPNKYIGDSTVSADPNPNLKQNVVLADNRSLWDLAQGKMESKFQEAQCRWLNKHTGNKGCKLVGEKASWETIDHANRPEALMKGWLSQVEKSLDKIPTQGQTSIDLWSDDYWRLEWGGISYRYYYKDYFDNYRDAISSYFQPSNWEKLLASLPAARLSQEIETWAPSEKYDLSVNDLKFNLTNEQKREGEAFVDESGNVESWMGLCHGWAAAAIMAPKPTRSVEFWGPEGTRLKFFPHDIRALTSLAWANGDFVTSFVGERCNNKTPEFFENGRIKDSDCFDNNPGSFHLALGNMIGIAKASFVMDAAFDYQVWNQPIQAYALRYFSPLEPNQQSSHWAEVAVPYDSKFKSIDPFQKPLTRGVKNWRTGVYDDSEISKIVGVIVTVVYLGEVAPLHGERASSENLIRVTYTYDLELTQRETGFEVTGGEWHSNAHPDFLWVPSKGAVAHSSLDQYGVGFTGRENPPDRITRGGQMASQGGYPLCPVISKLLKESSAQEYSCPVW